MKTILAIIFLASIARADLPEGVHSLQELYSSCYVAVGAFLSPEMGAPRPDCNYPIANVVVFQKVKDGYLLSADYEMGATEPGLIFLKTTEDMPKGSRFDPGNSVKIHTIGTYKYMGLDGFEKQVWAFEGTRPEGN